MTRTPHSRHYRNVVTFMYGTKFEWDPAKAESKWRKHGVRFAVAAHVFNDPHALLDPERFVDN